MASRKRLASWSTALSEERVAREEAEDEQLAAERQVEELQDQIAEVEAEREGLESQLAAVGAEREAHAETERDLEDALEELQDMEELTASLQAELEALRGGESARSRAPPSAGAWPRCRRCGWHPVSDPELPGAAPTPTTRCSFCRAHMPAGCTHCGQCGMREVGGEAGTIPAELRKTVAFMLVACVEGISVSDLRRRLRRLGTPLAGRREPRRIEEERQEVKAVFAIARGYLDAEEGFA